MYIEKFHKTPKGPSYYTIYIRLGSAVVSVGDFRVNDEETAVKKAKAALTKALEEINQK